MTQFRSSFPGRIPTPLACALACALAVTILLSACERIAPVRTLPAWVQGVYVPMIKNKSYEPGLEEVATRLTQEAFLDDGRLRVTPHDDADLTVVAVIEEWRTATAGTSGDDIATDEAVMLVASLKLYEPFNDKEPLADLGQIIVDTRFNIDTRSVDFDAEPDRHRRTLESLARQIVDKTISGFPADLRDLPEGVTMPKITSPDDIRRPDIMRPEGQQAR